MATGKGHAGGLPGQTMDLDAVSEGEKEDDIQEVPVTGKRKSQAGASPTKRDKLGGDAFSWSSLRSLLADQTKELQNWYRQEIGGAVAQSEAKVMKALDETKTSLTGQIEEGGKRVGKMEANFESILARLDKLESKPAMSGPSGSGGAADRGPALVFGGWRTDTKKALVTSGLVAVLKDAQVDGLLDSPPWVPAVRHSVAIAEFAVRKDENADGLRARMMAIIAAVNGARVQSENTAECKTIWAAVSRPRSDRGSGAHCGKTRKLFYQLGLGVAEVEGGYSTGSTWFKDSPVSSVEKVRNHSQVQKGIMDHSWIDLALIGKLSGKKEKDLEEVWAKIVQG